MNYAGMPTRGFAYFIDQIILALFCYLVLKIKNFQLGLNATEVSLGAIQIFYFAFFESSLWQATPGKMLLKLRVTSEDGNKISFWLALWRSFLKIPATGSGGVLIAFLNEKSQGLHDLICGTVVCESEGNSKEDEINPLRYNSEQ